MWVNTGKSSQGMLTNEKNNYDEKRKENAEWRVWHW